MALTSLNTLKSWVVRGWKPLATQVKDLLDSFWHKDESIPINKIEDLQTTLNGFVAQAAIDSLIAVLFPYKLTLNADGIYVLPAGFKLIELTITPTLESNVLIGSTVGGNQYYSDEEPIAAGQDRTVGVEVIARVNTTLHFTGIVSPTTILIYRRTLTPSNP